MHPVLFVLGPFAVSSFGFFLALAFLSAVFVAWRLSKIYDLNEEKIFDIAILTFLCGMAGARIYFVANNWEAFGSVEKVIWINRYPGLSYWGGMVGGLFGLWYFTRKFKLSFWNVADFTAVAFLVGQALGDFGCFLGGCAYGVPSNLPVATPVVGLIGKRIPISFIEGVVFLIIFLYLWNQAIKFHFAGKIVALAAVASGVVKFVAEFYRGDSRLILPTTWVAHGHIWGFAVFVAGVVVFYSQSKRNILADIWDLISLFYQQRKREMLLSVWKKTWYNNSLALKMLALRMLSFLKNLPKNLRRRFNVKSTPTNLS